MPEGTPEDIAFEAAANERYLTALGGAPIVISTPVVLPANTKWTTTGSVRAEIKAFGPLAARIGLRGEDEDLGTAFYIGERRMTRGTFDAEVVSWAAPVAKVFYDPANCDHEIMDAIVARRSLLTSGNRIVRVFDEWVNGEIPSPSPFAREALVVTPVPTPVTSSRRARPGERSRPAVPLGDASKQQTPPATQPESTTAPSAALNVTPARPPQPARTAAATKVREGMRAAESVDYALARPRNDALESLLATIQPDQYEMITARPDRPLLLQGHPGTGKSVIAIHRAAYLVNPVHLEPANSGIDGWPRSVLFVGPTPEWRHHVERAVRSLDPQRRVTVMAMPDLLAALAMIRLGDSGGDPNLDDVARFVNAVAHKAVAVARKDPATRLGKDRSSDVAAVYGVIREGRTKSGLPLQLQQSYTRAWTRKLPDFRAAREQHRYHGLFAAIGRNLFKGHLRFGHIVVDEAQDVTGVEWSLLNTLNAEDNWTLVGDMNQRRNDYVDSSWEGIADRLYMGAVAPRILERGYRSTQPILDFAKALLPRSERTAVTLQQNGPPVEVKRAATAAALGPTALAEAKRLLNAYPHGTVGVIAARPEPVQNALLHDGWKRDGDNGWRRDGQALRLLTHVSSRGVEFDGVVVVEPSEFPQNLGRIGPLYTSLTRANRELVVVNHAALPDALRRHNKAG